ncbi:MAG: hypothetical protein ABJC61_15525 [Acidobacteriota bacterium]
MADPGPAERSRLRIVPPGEPPPVRRARRPGPAVLLVLLYGAIFAAGLWWLRARSPLFRARRAGPSGTSAPPAAGRGSLPPLAAASLPDRRRALLAGEGLSGASAEKYAERLAAEHCTCGCDLALNLCLARDTSCTRSPELAERIRDSLR